ncbi:DsbA family protein [Brucella pituitosa]|uniref:DsbA family protein n=1 Tax=Brucella pituitosa TaxID=571256 RepID=UPI0012601268|nr:hypothetical protein [Brucella pituitosa]
MNNKLVFAYYLLVSISSTSACLGQQVGCRSMANPLSPYAEKLLHADGSGSKRLFTLEGMDVWLTKAEDEKATIVFTTPNGLLIRGTIFGPDGQDIVAAVVSPQQLRQYRSEASLEDVQALDAGRGSDHHARNDGPRPTAQTTTAQALVRADGDDAAVPVFKTLAQLRSQAENYLMWFEANRFRPNAPVLYMFADPLCSYCSRSLLILKPYLERGDIELRLVPTPILSRLSFELATSFVQEHDPGAAFIRHAAAAPESFRQSDILPHDQMDKAVIDAMARNLQWFRSNGLKGVPFYLYRSDAGDQVFYGQIDDNRIQAIMRGDKDREGDPD